jgi:hypothetical protein
VQVRSQCFTRIFLISCPSQRGRVTNNIPAQALSPSLPLCVRGRQRDAQRGRERQESCNNKSKCGLSLSLSLHRCRYSAPYCPIFSWCLVVPSCAAGCDTPLRPTTKQQVALCALSPPPSASAIGSHLLAHQSLRTFPFAAHPVVGRMGTHLSFRQKKKKKKKRHVLFSPTSFRYQC